MNQQFSLRWNNYLSQVTDAFGFLRNDEDLVDVTLSCEGKKIKAHKMLLSACSSYFRDIFKENPCKHPVIVFRNVNHADLLAIIDFMYKGEVNVLQEQLESFLSTAELLEVKGLTDGCDKDISQKDENGHSMDQEQQSVSTQDQFINRICPKTDNEPVVSYSSATSKSSTPPPKKRRYSSPPLPSNPETKKNPTIELSNASSVVPKIEKIEIVEDLTCEDDEDDTENCEVSGEDLTQHFQSGTSESFLTSSISLDESQNRCVNLGQDLVGGPGTLMEIVAQQAYDATEKTIKEKLAHSSTDDKQCLNDGKRNLEIAKTLIVEQGKGSCKVTEHLKMKDTEQKENVNQTINEDQDSNKQVPKTIEKSSGKLHIPTSLTVTVISENKEKRNEDISADEVLQSEDDAVLRSEEAKTPFQEENASVIFETHESSTSDLLNENDSEMAAEAPTIQEEVPVEEEKEPEFDYYGCQTCKAEAKPVSDQFSFTHKCPICPCLCFCSHLLKEHMRHIHGWFNVKRSFQHY